MDSILLTVKKKLGIPPSFKEFDEDIIVHINAAFNVLHQVGFGPDAGFSIDGEDAVWTDFNVLGAKGKMVEEYVYLYTKCIFDPPSTANVLSAYQARAEELLWRLNVEVDPGKTFGN